MNHTDFIVVFADICFKIDFEVVETEAELGRERKQRFTGKRNWKSQIEICVLGADRMGAIKDLKPKP